MSHNYYLTTIILAAGKGKRMLSSFPKWSHKVGNFSLLEHAIYKAKHIGSNKIIGVFAPQDKEYAEASFHNINIVIQNQARGTAHAVLSVKNYVNNTDGIILVLYCDTPLISDATLKKLISLINNNEAQVAFVGFNVSTPNSYGKLVVKDDDLLDIIETKDNKSYSVISLCNSGIVAISTKIIWELLDLVECNNVSNEYYLTSIVKIANQLGYKCRYVLENDARLAQGANTKEELSKLEKVFQEYKRKEFLKQGVTLIDPKTTFFSLDTKIGKNVIIYPFNIILRGVVIKDNVTIKSFSHISGVTIDSGANIGPYARIHDISYIGENVVIANFVEIKDSKINNDVKIKHLSYIGNTTIGKNTNIGAGTITCNYNGNSKYNTNIGGNSFIGSNVSLIAPINIGDNVTVGAGSVITDSISDNSLAISRSRQVEIKNWKRKTKKNR